MLTTNAPGEPKHIAPGVAELLSSATSPLQCPMASMSLSTSMNTERPLLELMHLGTEPPCCGPVPPAGPNSARPVSKPRRRTTTMPLMPCWTKHASSSWKSPSRDRFSAAPCDNAISASAPSDPGKENAVRAMVSRLRRRIRAAHLASDALHRQDEVYWAERSATTP